MSLGLIGGGASGGVSRGFSLGFTLVELLVVLAVLALLAGLVGPRVLNQLGGAKSSVASVQIQELEQAVDLFRIDVGRYPSEQEGFSVLLANPGGLRGWNGPYLRRALPDDPWGNPYRYGYPGRHGDVDIYTYGADNQPGGSGENADVGNWN